MLEKRHYMKNLKKFNQFITESRENFDGNTVDDLYEMGSEEIVRAAYLIVYGDDWKNEDPEKAKRWNKLIDMSPYKIIEELKKAIEIETNPKIKRELEISISSIEEIDEEISILNKEIEDDDEWDEDDEHNPKNFDYDEDEDW